MMDFASSKKQEYKTNEGNSAIINTNSSYSNGESLNPQVEEQIEFRRAYDQGKGAVITRQLPILQRKTDFASF